MHTQKMGVNTTIYRSLTQQEIDILSANGCKADDWAGVEVVSEGFAPERICRCRFKGKVRIGAGVTIKDVGSFVANYTIGNRVKIVGVGILETKGESSFGNGVQVATINENGGRSISIYDDLTSQSAYVCAMYRHRPKTVEALERIALAHTQSVTSVMGTIEDGARVCDCKIIRNVRIGRGARVVGASILQNGTILSTDDSPTEIGVDVKMYDFVVQEGSSIDNGSLLRRCFVGQSVIIENLTATDSLIFANSHMENCEACSIFAGPFTVSHHASSLLIAGMFSFFNAGSGTNQSNHLFRTGAVHQGIHLRGVKFGSNAYTMLPCRNGAFTVVIGRHRNNADTDNFPYSYLVEKEGTSYLMPAKNLMSYGTVRDLGKWPQRDKRRGFKRDNISFDECTPYIGVRIMKAIELLTALLDKEGVEGPEVINWGRMKLTRKAAMQGRRIYEQALSKYLADMLTKGALREECDGSGHWIDCGGEFMPMSQMNLLLAGVESGDIGSAGELKRAFDVVADNYDDYAYSWAVWAASQRLGHPASQQELEAIVAQGRAAGQKLREITEADKMKDFESVAQVGYGIDAQTPEEALADFKAVRGE